MWTRRCRAVLWASLSSGALGHCLRCDSDPVGAAAQRDAHVAATLEAGREDDGAPSDAIAEPGLVGRWTLDSDPNDSVGDNHGVLLGGASFVERCAARQRARLQWERRRRSSRKYARAELHAMRLGCGASPRAAWGARPSKVTRSFGPTIQRGIDDFALAVLNDRLSYINYNEKATGTASVINGKWHHIAATRQDGARVALYVDGQTDGDGNSGTGVVSANPNVYFCGVPGGRHFEGLLDDVRLYDRVLSPSEVAALAIATR